MPLLTATFAGMCPVGLSPRPPPPRPERLVSPAPEPRDGALRTALIQAPGCLKIGVSRSWRQQVLQLLQGSQLSPAQSSAVACLFLRHPGPAGQLPPEAERQTVEIILNPDQLHHPFATQFAGLVVPLGITPTSGFFLPLTRPYSDCPFRGGEPAEGLLGPQEEAAAEWRMPGVVSAATVGPNWSESTVKHTHAHKLY